ncbi:MAG: siphovirus Gp157 family protein [Lachnospiraceae bacterium]|nr:siphovirus Gp157 family protein [Lachnospiraceae bacterium]
MKLYEITDQYLQLLELAEDPEVDPEVLADTMEALDGDFEEKADGYAKVIAQINADADAIKKETDRLTARRKALENSAKRIKDTLQMAMIACDKRKFKTTLFSFGIQKNPASVVMETDNVFEIPAEYLVMQDPTIDKNAIKDALKNGVDLTGIAHFEQGESLRIR